MSKAVKRCSATTSASSSSPVVFNLSSQCSHDLSLKQPTDPDWRFLSLLPLFISPRFPLPEVFMMAHEGDRRGKNILSFFKPKVGGHTSPHNNAVQSVEGLRNVGRHIDKVINAQSAEEIQKNRLRLKATIESVRWLSLQACAFTGHDESPDSKNRGNLIEMIKLMGKLNVEINDVVLENAPKNAKYTSPTIQKKFCIFSLIR
ncbi:uncharacterized protein LOC130753881 isoform X1 [Actinidia eriantha]|uniref:uncharacterized protein LOC130753881 isoform X1 n=1 Tax=Actinidia eriantha TaxID=165200 RepID=UPI00258C424D|nr:uncharacterized protein LOC130753881 isoform X1 [Actinidia eriantha]